MIGSISRSLLALDRNTWKFTHGKHSGKYLTDVIKDDYRYVKWLVEECYESLEDEPFYAAKDLLGMYDDESRNSGKIKKNSSKRKTRN